MPLSIGNIFDHEKFTYPDGGERSKLLILLNTPVGDDNYLFCTITSQQHFRSKTYGCNIYKEYFFVPIGYDWFDKDTWILFDTIKPWKAASILKDSFDGLLYHQGTLESKRIREIVNCIQKTPTIENIYKSLIK